MAKTRYEVFASVGDGMAWRVDTFDNLLAAKHCANGEKGAAYVVKVDREKVYQNKKRSPDKVRPLRDALQKIRPMI